MPGYVVHQGASVMCSHGGTATPVVPSLRVTVSGQPIVTMPGAYAIVGCGLTGSAPPCATATFITAATRVSSMLQPVLLQDSQSICVAPGTPLQIVATQMRVSAM